MASVLTLDRSDPGVDELVSKWKDGGKYTVELEITQNKSSANAATFDVTGISSEAEDEGEAEVESEPEMPMKEKMPMKGKMGMKVEY